MNRKKLIKAIAMLLACWTCFGLASCNTKTPVPEQQPPIGAPDQEQGQGQEQAPEGDAQGPSNEVSITVNGKYDLAKYADSMKIYGRTSVVGNGISCDFTASGIEFTAYMDGDVKLHLSCTANTYFTVYVDGVRMEDRYLVTPTDSVITLASFDTGGEHTLRVIKQTEPLRSLSVLEMLEFTGYMKNPPVKRT